MTIYYDAGYQVHRQQGAYAIVLVDAKGHEHLLDYGFVSHSSSSEMEHLAAAKAGGWAREYGVSLVRGDFVPSLERAQRDFPDIRWEYVRSKGNCADKFAKVYEVLI
ncbi:MAG: hypothetical protein LC687_07950 [Actinobacteria bacterium]|nr:hypothetical protein [Actinomycetota bacterium]